MYIYIAYFTLFTIVILGKNIMAGLALLLLSSNNEFAYSIASLVSITIYLAEMRHVAERIVKIVKKQWTVGVQSLFSLSAYKHTTLRYHAALRAFMSIFYLTKHFTFFIAYPLQLSWATGVSYIKINFIYASQIY